MTNNRIRTIAIFILCVIVLQGLFATGRYLLVIELGKFETLGISFLISLVVFFKYRKNVVVDL